MANLQPEDDGAYEDLEAKEREREREANYLIFLQWQENGGLAQAAAAERAERMAHAVAQREAARLAAFAPPPQMGSFAQQMGLPPMQPLAADQPPSWMPMLLSTINSMQNSAGAGTFRSFNSETTAMMYGGVMAMKSLPAGNGVDVPAR
jgi:hypothetical protein